MTGTCGAGRSRSRWLPNKDTKTESVLAFGQQALGRFAAYAGVLFVLGACGFRVAVVRSLAGRYGTWARTADQRVAAAAAWTAFALIPIGLWRLWAEAYAIFGVDEGMSWEAVRIVVLDTPWGANWRVQMVAALAAGIAFLLARRKPRWGWWAAGASALFVGGTFVLTGHAMSEGPRVLSVTMQIGHVLGAGVWIGSLCMMVVFGLLVPETEGDPSLAASIVNAFSPVALAGAGLLVATGVVTAVVYLPALDNLWTTGYGRTLLLKVMAVATVAGAGGYNWRRLRPRLGHEPDATRLLVTSATIELLVAVAVLALTAVLVGLAIE